MTKEQEAMVARLVEAQMRVIHLYQAAKEKEAKEKQK